MKFTMQVAKCVIDLYDAPLSPHQNLDISMAFFLDCALNIQINSMITSVWWAPSLGPLYNLSYLSTFLEQFVCFKLI